mgnify:CR=1 FL=1
MNKNIMEGKWKQVKGEVRKRWGELTEDDVNRVQGSSQKLIGLLQERLGQSQDQATNEVAEFMESLEERFSEEEPA